MKLRACALFLSLSSAACGGSTNSNADSAAESAAEASLADSTADAPSLDAPALDGPLADGARACRSVSECGVMEDCIFANPGCTQIGVCTRSLACGRPSIPYCGCNGVTFGDTCEGPGAPWVSMGACPDAGADASATDASATDASATDALAVDSGGGACMAGNVCSAGLNCCGSQCVNLRNDPLNCGACGARCLPSAPMCQNGVCAAQSCSPPCGPGSQCCDVQGPGPSRPAMCYAGLTCPVGCPLCR